MRVSVFGCKFNVNVGSWGGWKSIRLFARFYIGTSVVNILWHICGKCFCLLYLLFGVCFRVQLWPLFLRRQSSGLDVNLVATSRFHSLICPSRNVVSTVKCSICRVIQKLYQKWRLSAWEKSHILFLGLSVMVMVPVSLPVPFPPPSHLMYGVEPIT